MKVVIDTNVLVSGIFFKGIPSKIIDSWFDNRFMVFATPLILKEYLHTIEYLATKKAPRFAHDEPRPGNRSYTELD